MIGNESAQLAQKVAKDKKSYEVHILQNAGVTEIGVPTCRILDDEEKYPNDLRQE